MSTQLKKSAVIAVSMISFVVIAANLAFGAYYLDKVYPGVQAAYATGSASAAHEAKLSLGGLTRQQAKRALQRQAASQRLSLQVDDQSYRLAPVYFGAHHQDDLTVEVAYRRGHGHFLALWGWYRAGEQPIRPVYSLDQLQLKTFVDRISSSHTKAPVDAAVVVTDGVAAVQPDQAGLGVDKPKLAQALQDALGNGSSAIKVRRGPVAADIGAAEAAKAAVASRNMMASRLALTFATNSFTPTPRQIGGWLRFDKTGGRLEPVIDTGKLANYVAALARVIDIAPVNKKITLINGEVKSEAGGSDGLAVDQETLVKAIARQLASGLPASLAVPTRPVAYKTEYNRVVNLDGASRYIEINLSTQQLWAYQDKQVAYQSPVTSGATGAGFPTVQGLFSIQAKQTNRNLNGYAIGYDYNVFVQYWMPFYGNYGLHDASWRSSFGGSDYYSNGSHGCVNLPAATAAWLFNWANVGTPVWVHS
ncbi:MAG TPA: L,D-transpeptidase family protein [Candidatus Saccharimonadales bacterium]|nr:L,D-transpeptidase family protein [Candidatus Saccharimonadales bacterium]